MDYKRKQLGENARLAQEGAKRSNREKEPQAKNAAIKAKVAEKQAVIA